MKAFLSGLVAVLATGALAQGAPVVSGSTGALSYSYAFALPAARGRYQPSLALDYNSDRVGNDGYGWGWELSTSYIERDSRASYDRNGQKAIFYLVRGGGRVPLVATSANVYRPDVESGFFEVQSQGAGWVAKDAAGNSYTYACATQSCGRWYLSRVVDPDQNITAFEYSPEGASSTALLTAVRYNTYDPANPTSTVSSDTGVYETNVELTYHMSKNLVLREEVGSLVEHTQELESVALKNRNEPLKKLVTVLTYSLDYLPAPDSGQNVLQGIKEIGSNGESGPRTAFGYGSQVDGQTNSTWQLDGPTSMASMGTILGAGFESAHPAWIDMDGDGRPDLVYADKQGGRWARNLTATGSANLTFDQPRYLPSGFPPTSFGALPAGNYKIMDFNGDGIPDVLSATSTGIYLSQGGLDQSGNYQVTSQQLLDTTAPESYWLALHGTPLPINTAGVQEYTDIEDVNGDGIPDFIIADGFDIGVDACKAEPSTTVWHVFPGYLDPSGNWGFLREADYSVIGVTPIEGTRDSPWACNKCGDGMSGNCWSLCSTGMSAEFFDINGDGLKDRVRIGSQGGISVELNVAGRFVVSNNASWNLALGKWSAGLNAGADEVFSPQVDTTSSGCGLPVASDVDPSGGIVDLNGDGLPDFLLQGHADLKDGNGTKTGQFVYWNTGRSSLNTKGILPPSTPIRSSWLPAVTANCPCGAKAVAERGVDALAIDLNGDGIPDYVRGGQFYAGRNGLDVAQTVLMRTVTVEDGAAFQVTYQPSSMFGFGVRRPIRPVVKSVQVSGPAMEPVTTQYWFASYTSAPSWLEPQRWDGRGFTESWSQDSVTGVVRHVKWGSPQLQMGSSR